METKEQSIEEVKRMVMKPFHHTFASTGSMERHLDKTMNLVNQACIDVLEEYVKRVKPLLNTVTSQETLEVMFEKFKAEKNLVNESEVETSECQHLNTETIVGKVRTARKRICLDCKSIIN